MSNQRGLNCLVLSGPICGANFRTKQYAEKHLTKNNQIDVQKNNQVRAHHMFSRILQLRIYQKNREFQFFTFLRGKLFERDQNME